MNFRFNALLVAAIVTAGAAHAGPKEDLLRQFGQCGQIKDDSARLSCFDLLAPRVNAVAPPPAVAAVPPAPTAPVPASPPPESVATVAPPIAPAPPPTPKEQESWFGRNVGGIFGTTPEQQTTPEKFGADQLPPPPPGPETPREIDSITAGVSDVAYNAFGQFVVFLDNGQIWRQLQGDADRAHFKKKAADNKVRISRGLLGSYNLTLNDSAKVFKVERIK